MGNCRLLVLCLIMFSMDLFGQSPDEVAFKIREIYDHTLRHGECQDWLQRLSDDIGGRLAGSPQAEEAVAYTHSIMREIGTDTSWTQACRVPVWLRGEKEVVKVSDMDGKNTVPLNALALGNSVGSGPEGVSGEVIEVFGLDTLAKLGEKVLKDKIVFFNRPMDPTKINVFHAYAGAVDQRGSGADVAGRFGAKAVLVRSMTTLQDDLPHTGALRYRNPDNKIPAVAISTNDANKLSRILKEKPQRAFVRTTCGMADSTTSYNVIGEIRGSEFPDEIILVGGHLDSWDVGGGAHDDGAGCVQSLQVFKTLKAIGYTPKRTLRCVMFMNEENGLAGGRTYARLSNEKGEFHLAAIESDAGGFTPRGFGCSADPEVFEDYLRFAQRFLDYLSPYDLYIKPGGGGADIGPLKSQKGLLIGLRPDSQRYFDFHHTTADVFENVNVRELQLGAAAMTSLVYLIDQFGLYEE